MKIMQIKTIMQIIVLTFFAASCGGRANNRQKTDINHSLEDVIVNTIKAYQNHDEKTLNELILRDFGITFIHRPGASDDFLYSEKISFVHPEPEYHPYETDFTVDY